MPARVLIIIGDRCPVAGAGLGSSSLLQAKFCCEHISWDSFDPERLSKSKARLIIALTVGESARAISLFQWLVDHPVAIPTLAVLPEEPDEELLQAASQAADDLIFWPVREGELRQRVTRILGAHDQHLESVSERLRQEIGLGRLIGEDAAFLRAIEKIPLIAASDATVLLLGETGTGKELCARAIHHLSRRRNFPFIPVECGALPEPLAENELFGHRRGAFTDAHSDQKGLAAMAEGGTLFLDEVDALSLATQAKLLRFLQEGSYRPLGGEGFSQADVRVVAASNHDLESLSREGQFRSDLYFRLNVLQISLPPLRERRSDIGLLARHFLESLSAGKQRKSLSAGTVRGLEQYDWPGNVRELFNLIQRAVVFCPGPVILPSHISLPEMPPNRLVSLTTLRQARLQAIESFERTYIVDVLRKSGGNITQAAATAGKDRRAFGRLVKKYAIDRKAL